MMTIRQVMKKMKQRRGREKGGKETRPMRLERWVVDTNRDTPI